MAEEVEKYKRKQEMQAEAHATGDQGCLMVEFGDFQGRSMKDVYEDQSKQAQALIRYLIKANPNPNTNMAIFKTYVLKRQASAVGTRVCQPAPQVASSSASAPPPATSSSSVHPRATSSASAPPPATPSASVPPPATSSASVRPRATSSVSAPSPAAIKTGVHQSATVKALLTRGKHLSPSHLARKLMSPVKHYPLLQSTLPPPAAEPPVTHLTRRQLFTTGTSVSTAEDDDDEELVFAASQCEAQLNTETCSGPSPSAETAKAPGLPHHPPPAELPVHWKDHLPPFQHEWIRNTLFKANPRTGKPELVSQLKLWWYPPQVPLIHTQPPASPDLFFCRPLFLWMPLKIWRFPLVCVRPDCDKHKLTAAGLYRTVRKVLDIDGWYDLATEYSCDNRVLRMMRERTQGNSVTQMYKKLMEQHSEAWTQRVLQYLTACEPFTRSFLVQPPVFAEPPSLPALPKPKWLLAVYARDVLGRLHEVKAKITSVLGCVLKMDSTKKVTKKLAGAAAGTAAWCTNVGNEHGQVLVSVLTAAEGHGLHPMAAGLMKRYREAGEAAPKVMYVDRDCCSLHGKSQVKVMFSDWDELEVRLDIWHFMRRFPAGVTTEAHPLYGTFMARLSMCIFQWDSDDVAALHRDQPQLTHGRYKAPKRSGVTPGVESVKRCLIGHPGGPAQWPDANRLVNTICMKLCALHKSPTKKDGVCTPRWSKVLSDYHHIRELVLNNPTLMDETTIQLFEINHRTLTQWFRKWKNRQEMGVLGQGLTPSNPIAVADTHLPPPREKLNEVPSTSGPKHQFFLPPNREGQAPLLRPGRKPAAATREFPIASAPTASGVVQPIAPAPTASGVMQHILAPIAPAPTASGVVQPILAPIAPAPTASGVMQHILAPIAPAPTASGVVQHILAPIAPAPTASGVMQHILAPIAPAPTASGVVQHILAPGLSFGTVVFNPDMTVSVVIPPSGASTSSAVPAPPAPASAAPVSRYTQRNRRRRAMENESGVQKRNPTLGQVGSLWRIRVAGPKRPIPRNCLKKLVTVVDTCFTAAQHRGLTLWLKMYAYPVFQRQSATSSRLLMAPSAEAKHLEKLESGRAKSKEEVLAEARSFVSTNGGDPSDQFLVLAHCKLQFGKYQGQRF
nr:uncharacterized protein LOC129455635 [Misgurnus anguillicaudatus]